VIAASRYAGVAIYQVLRWANLLWLMPLGLMCCYAMISSRVEFLLWPVAQTAGVAGATFVRNEGNPVLAILLLFGLVGLNFAILNSRLFLPL